jgi:probable pyridine nucleotide-disulfide oxidoreductase
VVDDSLKAIANHIWALGDVNGGPQFTYIPLVNFRIVKSQFVGNGNYTRKERNNVLYSIFIDPILSQVGSNHLFSKV